MMMMMMMSINNDERGDTETNQLSCRFKGLSGSLSRRATFTRGKEESRAVVDKLQEAALAFHQIASSEHANLACLVEAFVQDLKQAWWRAVVRNRKRKKKRQKQKTENQPNLIVAQKHVQVHVAIKDLFAAHALTLDGFLTQRWAWRNGFTARGTR